MTAAQALVTEAFNSTTYIENKMDVQHTPIYDTVTLSAGSTITDVNSLFFTNVASNSGKTLAQTNMSQSQKLAAPEAFSIFGIRLKWNEDILPTDLFNILKNYVLEFWLGQKFYQRAPLWYFGAGGGVYGFNYISTLPASGAQTGANVLTNGWPARDSMHKLAIPIVIENQMTFFARLVGGSYTLYATTSGGTGAQFQLLLDGFYARGVQ